jgi:hypothetical protein
LHDLSRVDLSGRVPRAIFRMVEARIPAMRRRYGSLYTAGAFRTLVFAASTLAEELREEARQGL